jgi:uncharacterized protein
MTDIIAPYREALARGELLVQVCQACGARIMYPRHRCPECQSDQLGWLTASGQGTLNTYTVVRAVPPLGFEADLPYALGVVVLAEGVQLLARLWPSNGSDSWEGFEVNGSVEFHPASPEEIARRPVAWFRAGQREDAQAPQ